MKPHTLHADLTKTAIGYVRVSTQEQATEGVSLDAQRDRLRTYCKANGIRLAPVSSALARACVLVGVGRSLDLGGPSKRGHRPPSDVGIRQLARKRTLWGGRALLWHSAGLSIAATMTLLPSCSKRAGTWQRISMAISEWVRVSGTASQSRVVCSSHVTMRRPSRLNVAPETSPWPLSSARRQPPSAS